MAKHVNERVGQINQFNGQRVASRFYHDINSHMARKEDNMTGNGSAIGELSDNIESARKGWKSTSAGIKPRSDERKLIRTDVRKLKQSNMVKG